MKKTILSLALLGLWFPLAKAQYFFHHYGSTGYEEVFSGEVCNVNGPGHVMSGMTSDPNIPVFAPTLVRTDVDGNVGGAGTFQNYYDMWQNTTYTMPMRARECFTIELPNGNYAMAGSMYKDNTFMKMAVWYTWVDANGVPDPQWMNIMGLPFNMAYYESRVWHDWYTVEAFELSYTGTEAYIMGYQQDQVTMQDEVFVIKLDVTNGTLIWSASYLVPNNSIHWTRPQGMVENPAANEIAIVGASFNGWNEEGFLLRVDMNNGAIIATELFGDASSSEGFQSIIVSQATGNYIIAGRCDKVAGDNDIWMLEYDYNTQNVVNTQLYDYMISSYQNNNDVPYDLLERYSPMYGYEYFVMGQTDNGYMGMSDIFMYRMDLGFNFSIGATYATPFGDYGAAFDQDNSGGGAAPDGLSVYGLTQDPSIVYGGTTAADQVIHKVYYNMLYLCPFNDLHWTQNPGPKSMGPVTASLPEDFFIEYGWIENLGVLNDNFICYDGTIPGGSYDRLAPAADHLDLSKLQDGSLEISLDAQAAGEVTFDLLNLSGQVLATQKIAKPEGAWKGVFGSGDISLPAGIYLVRATSATGTSTERVLVH
jgi:hypothetical protein